MPEVIYGINGKNIYSNDIKIDLEIAETLVKI